MWLLLIETSGKYTLKRCSLGLSTAVYLSFITGQIILCTLSFVSTLREASRSLEAAAVPLGGLPSWVWVLASLFELLKKSENKLDRVQPMHLVETQL